MSAALTRLAFRKDIGLAIGDHELAVTQVTLSIAGRAEVVRDRVAYDEAEGLAAALERLLSRNFTAPELERVRPKVALPTLRVFFSTRPIQAENLQASPEVLLHEIFQSPSLSVDDMVVDLIKSKPGLRPLAGLAACRKKYLGGVLSALESVGIVPTEVEPSPSCLLREAGRRHSPPRKSRVYLRVFLGPQDGLTALMAAPELPLMWRPFTLPPGGEAAAILATIGAMRVMTSYCGLDTPPDAVLVHGRRDLGDLDSVANDPSLAGVKFLRHDEPGLDLDAVVAGLVQSPRPGVESFNLVRSIARKTTLRELFPWGQASIQLVVLIAITFWLLGRLQGHRAEAASVRGEDAKYAWAAKVLAQKLEDEKKTLTQRVDAIRSFTDTRICWTEFAHDIARKLPTDLALIQFSGLYELEFAGSKLNVNAKKFLNLGLNAPDPRTDAHVPRRSTIS